MDELSNKPLEVMVYSLEQLGGVVPPPSCSKITVNHGLKWLFAFINGYYRLLSFFRQAM